VCNSPRRAAHAQGGPLNGTMNTPKTIENDGRKVHQSTFVWPGGGLLLMSTRAPFQCRFEAKLKTLLDAKRHGAAAEGVGKSLKGLHHRKEFR
jgi:hypothetical protein